MKRDDIYTVRTMVFIIVSILLLPITLIVFIIAPRLLTLIYAWATWKLDEKDYYPRARHD